MAASQYSRPPLVCDVIELTVEFNLLNRLGDGVENEGVSGFASMVCRAVVRAVQLLQHVHNFISATPKGYDTMVGERGRNLSTNERAIQAELLAANGRYAQMWALQQSVAE